MSDSSIDGAHQLSGSDQARSSIDERRQGLIPLQERHFRPEKLEGDGSALAQFGLLTQQPPAQINPLRRDQPFDTNNRLDVLDYLNSMVSGIGSHTDMVLCVR